jgi:hypothetical protein
MNLIFIILLFLAMARGILGVEPWADSRLNLKTGL